MNMTMESWNNTGWGKLGKAPMQGLLFYGDQKLFDYVDEFNKMKRKHVINPK